MLFPCSFNIYRKSRQTSPTKTKFPTVFQTWIMWVQKCDCSCFSILKVIMHWYSVQKNRCSFFSPIDFHCIWRVKQKPADITTVVSQLPADSMYLLWSEFQMLKCRGYNPCPEYVSPVTPEGTNTPNFLPAEKPDFTEFDRIRKGRQTGRERIHGLPVKQFTKKAEMLRALTSDYKPKTLGKAMYSTEYST